MIRAGLALFAAGAVLIGIEFICFAAGGRDLPLWLDALAGTLAPAGFILALIGAVRAGCRDQRAAQDALTARD